MPKKLQKIHPPIDKRLHEANNNRTGLSRVGAILKIEKAQKVLKMPRTFYEKHQLKTFVLQKQFRSSDVTY